MAIGASPAAAQSIQGTGTFTNPGHGSIATGPGSTTITINAPQAVIDWTPTDNLMGNFGGINFQPAGTTATFTGASNYAVLNRVNVADPSRVLVFNGTINSLVGNQTGGSVYFYSPSGMVFSQSATVNVGSLVLSASPIAVDGQGNFINNGAVTFGQAPNPAAYIATGAFNGQFATFNAPNQGSYVAMVAPRVEHHGVININGSAALVAAEAATINFSPDGLFNIQVTSGTTDANGVFSDGRITGPASSGPGDNHRIYMVAVPKNQAMTMLIQGGNSLGFDIAGAANVVGNAVVLSAGHDVAGDMIQSARSSGSGTGASDLLVYETDFTSRVNAAATNLGLFSASTTTASMASNLQLRAANAQISALNSGVLDVTGSVTLDTTNRGTGTGATGGTVFSVATAGGRINIAGDMTLLAQGTGAAGGDGTGGSISAIADQGGRLTVGGLLRADADGDGGFGAIGRGGSASVIAGPNSTLIAGSIDVSADGWGGGDVGGGAGQGFGGTSRLLANGAGAVINAGTGNAQVRSTAYGGSVSSTEGGTQGGNATGGSATIEIQGGGSITAGDIQAMADAYGGGGQTAVGGQGRGGSARLSMNGGTLAASSIYLNASGTGGSIGLTGTAGAGIGGTANLVSQGGTNTLAVGDLAIDSSGYGGHLFSVDGTAGAGTGGRSYIYASAGSLAINGSAFLASQGLGGSGYGGECTSCGGDGGDALGGWAYVSVDSGSVHFLGDLTVSASAIGGDGDNGGDATGLDTGVGFLGAAAIATRAGGSLQVDGATWLDAEAIGGSGLNGNGGSAQAAFAEIWMTSGAMTFNGIDIYADAFGGSGANGGAGGNAQAVGAWVHMANIWDGISGPGTLTTGSINASAMGIGGDGGDGVAGATGGNGGAGGSGTGGSIAVLGVAGTGDLIADDVTAFAWGMGGYGGTGGAGSSGSGGAGGTGGSATGGVIQIGTHSGSTEVTTNLGSGTYNTVSGDGSAFGGTGGDGGIGATGSGVGGAGGDATGGGAGLLVRGSPVTIATANLAANALGGDGGLGSTQGAGGDATVGSSDYSLTSGIGIVVTDRFGFPTQRGQLTAGSIGGSAVATGGAGSTAGASTSLGANEIELRNADASVGSLSFATVAAATAATARHDRITVRDGSLTVSGQLSFTTTGALSLFVDNGTIDAGTMVLDAGNFAPDTVSVTPAVPGTVFADAAAITTDNDFITTANLDIGSDLAITAPGLIDAADMNGTGALALSANAGITAGDLIATGAVDLAGGSGLITVGNLAGAGVHAGAGGNIATGAIDSGLDVMLQSNGSISAGVIDAGTLVFGRAGGGFNAGDILAGTGIDIRANNLISLGGLDAGDRIDLRSNGGIATGNAASDDTIYYQTAGQVTSGSLTAGDAVLVQGRTGVTIGAVSAGLVSPNATPTDGYAARIASDGPVVTGAVAAAGAIGFYSQSTLTTGNLSSNQSVLAMVNGNMSLGAITTPAGGTVYLADDSMAALGGNFDNFNRAAVFAAFPVATSGSITINGPVTTGTFQAAAGTGFSSGAILAGNFIELLSGGGIATGSLTAPGDIELNAAGPISFGNVQASEFNFESGGSVSGGNIVATNHADGEAEGAIVLGDVTVNGPPVDGFSAGFASATSIQIGNVTGNSQVGFATLGDLTTGNLRAGDLVMALVGGDIATGSITTTRANGQVYMADASMFIAAGGGGEGDSDFDENIVLGTAPVATGGSITINGPVSTSLLRAAAGDNFVANAITAQGFTDPVIFDQGIVVGAGGTSAVGGSWTGESIRITSSDINIAEAGSLNTDWAVLTSTNATRTIIGDGVDGEGYRLSDAEYDRIRATGEIEVHANSALGAAPNMIIGDLSVTASAGSTGVEYEFVTSNGDDEDVGTGSIRVVGDATFAGMTSDEFEVSFTTGTFQLDAATGLLSLTGEGQALGGVLEIEANHIHVAEGAILDRLAATPRYSGYREDLNAPAAVQRPDGVIRARIMNLELAGGESSSLYVQNTGTRDTPAGFLFSDETFAEDSFVGEEDEFTAPAGSVDVIINGQIQTPTGRLTGAGVRDRMVADQGDLTPFTANSTINGCPLSGGSCGTFQENVPPGVEVAPSQMALLTSDPLGEFDFGNEPDIADGESGDDGSAGSPIEAPQPLFDTRPLTIESEVDDPISGTGNPALTGTCQSEDGEEGSDDDEGECQ